MAAYLITLEYQRNSDGDLLDLEDSEIGIGLVLGRPCTEISMSLTKICTKSENGLAITPSDYGTPFSRCWTG